MPKSRTHGREIAEVLRGIGLLLPIAGCVGSGCSAATAGTTCPDGKPSGAGGCNCSTGTPTSISQIMNGSVALGTQVALTGVVATSPKFLASNGATGTCYWGVFVSEPVAQAVPYSGALILALGTDASLDANGVYGPCPIGTDIIPPDTAPGDVLDVTSSFISYVKSTCATSTVPAPAPELRIGYACSIQRTATGHAVPTPATVPDLTELTNSAGEATHHKWTGVLIKLENVTGVDLTTAGPVGPTGTVRLTNGVIVRDRIYQPQTAVFGTGTTWNWIIGISHLDVCTWAIEPRNPCTDFNPRSQNCQ
jgi:hypothetical protein